MLELMYMERLPLDARTSTEGRARSRLCASAARYIQVELDQAALDTLGCHPPLRFSMK